MASTESDVRALMERRSEAIRTRDIDLLMSVYAPEIVYFDLVPPLRYAGEATLRDRFLHWFDGWESAIGQEILDLTIVASGDVAAVWMRVRASGTLKGGRQVGYWVRASDCCRRSSSGWVITHEHISLPVEFPSGKAVMDLVP